jgi:hypothetical protein
MLDKLTGTRLVSSGRLRVSTTIAFEQSAPSTHGATLGTIATDNRPRITDKVVGFLSEFATRASKRQPEMAGGFMNNSNSSSFAPMLNAPARAQFRLLRLQL